MTHSPWQFPDNPFDYVSLIDKTSGIGSIPESQLGSKIAVIGAGCSGLCAAYELMRIGLHPVVYESSTNEDGTPRIGGRAYTYRFPGDPKAYAELGAMRIPPVNRTLTYYMDKFGIDYGKPFPDPLTVPTVLYFKGNRYYIPLSGPLPPTIHKASAAWASFISPLVKKISGIWHDPELRTRLWNHYIDLYADKSFYQVLYEKGLSRLEIENFGSLGLGTGGFDSLYQVSFLEILRLSVCRWETDQRLITGGVASIPERFWDTPVQCTHWGQTSVKELNRGKPRCAVTEIRTHPNPGEKAWVTDALGETEAYGAVIVACSLRALEMGIKVNRSTFTDDVWAAIQDIHMIRSGKIFVRTKEAFWKTKPPESTLHCTITDEATRGTYLFDFEDTPSGVICLSYTWEDSATKFHALSEEEQLHKCLSTLEKIYGKDLISEHIEEHVSLFWEHEKGFNGAFKLNYPGQHHKQSALFRQPLTPPPPLHNGVYLAGETTSWAGGWIEGAIHSGLDASMSVIKRFGGWAAAEKFA